MKKTMIFAAIAAVAAISCTKENASAVRETEPFSISLGFEGVDDVKSSLYSGNSDDLKTKPYIVWGSQDNNLYAFDSSKTKNALTKTGDGTDAKRQRNFAGEVTKGTTIDYILYTAKAPARDTSKYDGNVIKNVKIDKSVTMYTGSSFGTTANISIWKPGASCLMNISGYIRFKNTVNTGETGGRIKSVKVETLTAGEYLAGDIIIDFSGDTPIASINPDGAEKSTSSTLLPCWDKNIPGNKGGYCYLCLLPGTYHGIKMTVEAWNTDKQTAVTNPADYTFTLTHSGDITIERSKFWCAGDPIATYQAKQTKASLSCPDFEQGWVIE